jgi:hypothetical protein
VEDGARSHTTKVALRALRFVYAELNAGDKNIILGKVKENCACVNNTHDLAPLKQNICEAFYTFSNVNCNKLSQICLKE